MSSKETCLVFYASKIPNKNGDLNWYEFKEYETLSLKVLQTLVGGQITSVPCLKKKTSFLAYGDDEGLLKSSARNDLAGGALYYLGFRGSEFLGCAYAGNVVVLGSDEQGLTPNQQQELRTAIDRYRSLEE